VWRIATPSKKGKRPSHHTPIEPADRAEQTSAFVINMLDSIDPE
jgi:hypothetical protein